MVLNDLAEKVFAVLAKYTAFPWPVLSTVAKRKSVDLSALTYPILADIAPLLADGVERYTSPDKGSAVRSALQLIVSRRT